MSGSSSWVKVAEMVNVVDSSGSRVRSDSDGTLTYSDPPSAVWMGSRERQYATWRLDSSTSDVLVIRPEIVTFWFGSSRDGRAGVMASMLTRAHDSGNAAWAVGAASSTGRSVTETNR